MLRMVACFGLAALWGCANSTQFDYTQTPIAIAPVEHNIADAEIFLAVERQVATAPVCIPIPQAYWEFTTPFTARFGPTEWGGRAISVDIEDRLNDFVQMGFWTRHDASSDGNRVARFQLTEVGSQYYRGHPFQPRDQAAFCAPGERRLLRIVETTRIPASRPDSYPAVGFFPPESLGVRFEWIGAESLSWLPTPELRERYRNVAPRHDRASLGSTRLFRVWRRDVHPLANAPHSGALEPYCYDNVHNRTDECWPYFQ